MPAGEDPERELTRLLREHDQGNLVGQTRPLTVRDYLEEQWLPHVRTRIREARRGGTPSSPEAKSSP